MVRNLAAHRAPLSHGHGDLALDVPDDLTPLKRTAAPEDWGNEDAVLHRYLAVHVPLAIGQGRFAWSGDYLVTRAGLLVTGEGAPVYLGLTRAEEQRWVLTWAGARPNNVEPQSPPDFGTCPGQDPRREVVVAMDRFPGPILGVRPLFTQNLIVADAVEWSVRRGMAVRHLRGYFAPVHLTDRDGAPEFAAAIQVQAERLVVRALVEPRAAYADARAVVAQRNGLPEWVRGA